LRIVLDTNVLVSGLLNPDGSPGRIVDLFLAGEINLVLDDRILAEYREVLHRPKFGFEAEDVSELLDLIDAESVRVAAPPLGIELTDPRDLPFVEVAGDAISLVTGNARHFKLPAKAQVTVESPVEFIGRWKEQRNPNEQ
jgi:putative PIN family toxin of toxin-antitoxin system